MFKAWMIILQQVPNSVLWLLDNGYQGRMNMIKFADKFSITSDRIIFAQRSKKSDHLARHRLADLALDTRLYNGHTTTCDALWAGIPVVTIQGNQFSSRVASSLLSNIGLEECIATTVDSYIKICLELALKREALEILKVKLNRNIHSEPLFNTSQYTHHLEALWYHLYQHAIEN